MTVKDFAAAMGKSYSTAVYWCQRGLIPGVVATEPTKPGQIRVWLIPETALTTFTPPGKGGRRKGSKNKKGKK